MKKFILSLLAVAALSSSTLAQSTPFEWKVGENTKIKLGGFIRINANYDFDGSVTGNDFITTTIPTSTAYSSEDRLSFDPSATRLSLMLTQSTEAVGDVNVYIEGDFRGTGNTIRLRQAYVQFSGFIAGQTWSFMSDLAAQAPTIDINGVGSRTFFRTALFGYRHSLSDRLTAGISLESPALTSDYIGVYEAVNQRMPNIPIYIQTKGGAGHLKAAAVFRSLQYGDSSTQERVSVFGVGGQLSGSLKLCSAATLFGQAIYGKGINTFVSDLSSVGLSNIMTTNGSDMEATPMGGASLGVSAKLAAKWSAALSGSLTRNYGDEAYFAGDYKSSSYVSALVQYAPAPRISLGLEYLNGSRTNFDGDPSAAQRMSFSIKYAL